MEMRWLTLFAVAYCAGTALLLFAVPRLIAEAQSGEPGAALLLIVSTAAIIAGARTAAAVFLAHVWRLCQTIGLAASPVRTAALRLAPHAARTALTAAVGGTLTVAALAGPSFAASPSPGWPLSPEPTVEGAQPRDDASHTGSQSPAWPLAEDIPTTHPSTPADNPSVHVVTHGESLWQIASSELPGADASTVTARVKDVHSTNRAVVGDDANLILPGQRLVLP